MKKILSLMIIMLACMMIAAMSAFADQSLIKQGIDLLNSEPPEYEKAAALFKRAGLQGDGEGYYRLGLMYEEGFLNVGNPCTDDLTALGKQKAEEYYALAAKNGYDTSSHGWQSITQDEAKQMMDLDGGQVIVDVRRQDEYESGHIPGAILIPNESIGTELPEELPDLNQIILIYCRSGNRSKQASQKLADLGYRNVYEFGGIIDWTGEIVTKEAAAMVMKIGETEVPVTWEENASVGELKSLLPLTIQMSMYGGFEQVGSIGQSIVRDDAQTTTNSGDIVLYSGNQIVVFYGSNTWSYTRLGHINLPQQEMTDLLGHEDVTITISES